LQQLKPGIYFFKPMLRLAHQNFNLVFQPAEAAAEAAVEGTDLLLAAPQVETSLLLAVAAVMEISLPVAAVTPICVDSLTIAEPGTV
jgi:hypothetical protein